jgi:hypothetical protein
VEAASQVSSKAGRSVKASIMGFDYWPATSREHFYTETRSMTIGVSLEGVYSRAEDDLEDLSTYYLSGGVRLPRF